MKPIPRRPIQVYLDSSDFSNLSVQDNRPQERVDVEQKLLEWQSEGLIELRFSSVHVTEASPVEQRDVRVALRRLLYIKKVCGLRCFAHSTIVMEQEAKRLCMQIEEGIAGGLYRNDGTWFPDLGDIFSDISSPEALVREYVDGMAFDRKSRRKIERTLFDEIGRLKPKAKESLQTLGTAALAEAVDRFPLTSDALKTIGQYLTGNGSREHALRSLHSSFADLECFAKWYETHWDEVNPTSAWLRQSGNNLRQAFINVALQVESNHENAIARGLSSEQFWELGREPFKDLLRDTPINIAKGIAKSLEIDCNQDEEVNTWHVTPSLQTAVTVGAHIARRTAMVPGTKRSPSTSDFGDIFHTLYLPHVDVFRADAFIASVIKEAKLPFKTDVVGNFLELPKVIEKRLATKLDSARDCKQ